MPILCFIGYACRPDEACIGSGSNGVALQFVVRNDSLTTPPADTVEIENITTPNLSGGSPLVLFPISAADTLIAEGRGFTTLFRLGLNPNSDTTILVFEAQRRTDSLVLAYQRRYQLLSPDCPINVNYQNLEVIRHTFDDVEVLRTDLSDFSATPDIYIYY